MAKVQAELSALKEVIVERAKILSHLQDQVTNLEGRKQALEVCFAVKNGEFFRTQGLMIDLEVDKAAFEATIAKKDEEPARLQGQNATLKEDRWLWRLL